MANGRLPLQLVIYIRKSMEGIDLKSLSPEVSLMMTINAVEKFKQEMISRYGSYSAYRMKRLRDRGFSGHTEYNNHRIKRRGYKSFIAYLDDLARNAGFQSYQERRKAKMKKNGYKSSWEYQKELVRRKGFLSVSEYKKHLAERNGFRSYKEMIGQKEEDQAHLKEDKGENEIRKNKMV